VSAADVTIATVPGPTNNTTQDENAPTIRADISTYNVSSKAAWLGLGCRCPCLVLAGSVAEGAKPACASEETPVLPPTSSAHPFQVFLRRTPSGSPSHTHPTTSLAHPGPRVTVAIQPDHKLGLGTVQYSTVPEETPRHPKGKFTHPPVGGISTHCSSLTSIGFINLPSKTFIVLCPLVP
jgi:hypothetical protein